ncbi:MAG TPA: LamG-like jellyroll fold domain-containing protein, partial [Flavisolibacter sp.]|nr:LamG-like jellyroll fold domain-containing protein [Flavisolibacter sp.]
SGTYTFRTNSDDGSRLWLNAYDFNVPSLVNNDGLHGGQNRDGTITLTAGTYPIAIAFYEQSGGEAMSISWKVPGSSSFVSIPNSAFADQPVADGVPPTKPSNLSATAVSYKRINLSWTDNSDNETGFEIWRSASPQDGYNVVGNVVANTTHFADSINLSTSTTYYYRVRAIGQYGESALIPALETIGDAQANWRFNNNYTDATGNGKTVTASGTPAFNANDKQEGTHALNFNGTSQHLDINTTAGDYIRGSYSAKSVSFWMKSNSNTGGRIILDLGGSDNGLALSLNTNLLAAGVASNNVRKSISSVYTSNGWNYITLVYNANTLRLYVNGSLTASNTNLGFNSIGATSNGSRIANVNGSNAFGSGTARFSGLIDNFVIFNRELTQTEITALMDNSYGTVKATTLQLPGTPSAPTDLLAYGASTSAIAVTWADNAVDEEKYELYRSGDNNGNYILYKSLPANATSF